ncbi:hypothetical protein Ddc_16100 [Ditylenchus destructor]|nr:hypothetical protein Ddc_16100 [Ditylenchus destructor]
MSVDKTIEELSGTLAQLGVLVEHINHQILGITGRINMTLDNFDRSVAGIASDAGLMTGQVGDTISQVPSSWVFYLLFFAIIVVLVLLSILILINLIARIHETIAIFRGDHSRMGTPLPSMAYSESKQPLNVSYPGTPQTRDRLRHIAVPMETEPRRFGYGASSYTPMQPTPGEFSIGRASLSHPHRTVTEETNRQRRVFHEVEISPRTHNYSVTGSSNGTDQPPPSLITASATQATSGPFVNPRAEAV